MPDNDIPAWARIEIIHADGSDLFESNGLLVEFGTDRWRARDWKPARDEKTGEVLKSMVSNEPALLLRTFEADIPLTGEEMRRFVCRALEPSEYHALYAAYGDIYDLHDDYYDPESGEAFQSAI